MSDRYCIIDTDCGIDDSQAIMIAICQKVNILAITCVTGSVHVDQVVKNVAYVLKMCNRSDIPVYKGAAKPILGKPVYSTEFHGRDGLGDIPDREDDEVFLNQVLKDEDGISTLVRLVNEYEGKIDIASIAPLTNIALAQRLDSNFASKLSSITIMGGNHEGKGNTTPSAEFNFYSDPEAAHIVIKEFPSVCITRLLTWETALLHSVSWQWVCQWLGYRSEKGRFNHAVFSNNLKFYRSKLFTGMAICDPIVVALTFNPELIIKSSKVNAEVELNGKLSRGQLVVDWLEIDPDQIPRLEIILKLNLDAVKDMMINAAQF